LKKDYTEPYNHIFGTDKQPLPEIYKDKKFMPIVSQNIHNDFVDLPFPTADDWRLATGLVYPNNCKKTIKSIVNWDEWNDRKSIAVFRGSATGCGTTIKTNQRLHLASLNNENLDAKLTSLNLRDKVYNGSKISFLKNDKKGYEFLKNVNNQNRLSMEEQMSYKYIIYVDGHAAAYRYSQLMTTGSTILKVESLHGHKLWFFDMLIPYDKKKKNHNIAHYIHIDKGLRNIDKVLEWCKKNNEKCLQIAKNSMEFYNKYLTKESIIKYTNGLLNRISNKYKNNVNDDDVSLVLNMLKGEEVVEEELKPGDEEDKKEPESEEELKPGDEVKIINGKYKDRTVKINKIGKKHIHVEINDDIKRIKNDYIERI
jgi:hypothetical protein